MALTRQQMGTRCDDERGGDRMRRYMWSAGTTLLLGFVLAALALAGAAPARAAGSGGASAQDEAVARGDWMQFGFLPSGGRSNPFERDLSPANVAGLALD